MNLNIGAGSLIEPSGGLAMLYQKINLHGSKTSFRCRTDRGSRWKNMMTLLSLRYMEALALAGGIVMLVVGIKISSN